MYIGVGTLVIIFIMLESSAERNAEGVTVRRTDFPRWSVGGKGVRLLAGRVNSGESGVGAGFRRVRH